MEPEGSLPCSQEPATCPYPEPNESNPHPPNPISLRSIFMLPSHLLLGLPSGLLPSGLRTKMLYAPLTTPMRVTCPAHHILLALITLTILGEEYKPCGSSLCSFLQPPVTSSLFGPNILLSALFSNTLIYVLPLTWESRFHTHTKPQVKL
jgi:hypothetical protein